MLKYKLIYNMTKKRTPSAAPKEEKKAKVEPTPVVETIQAPPKVPEYIPKPFELGRKATAVLPTSLGLPKSKKPWKGLSERSGKHKKMNPKTWQ
jgi:hypothetical protein